MCLWKLDLRMRLFSPLRTVIAVKGVFYHPFLFVVTAASQWYFGKINYFYFLATGPFIQSRVPSQRCSPHLNLSGRSQGLVIFLCWIYLNLKQFGYLCLLVYSHPWYSWLYVSSGLWFGIVFYISCDEVLFWCELWQFF